MYIRIEQTETGWTVVLGERNERLVMYARSKDDALRLMQRISDAHAIHAEGRLIIERMPGIALGHFED